MALLKEILLVDDDSINLLLCELLSQKEGFAEKCVKCFNGLEAINYLKKTVEEDQLAPDLIFLDINMPVMNGWDFLNEFEQIKPMLRRRPKIIVLSSSPDPNDVTKAYSYSEVIHFISKPLQAQSLRDIRAKHFQHLS
jgi:CheY-like chemotaxis protein